MDVLLFRHTLNLFSSRYTQSCYETSWPFRCTPKPLYPELQYETNWQFRQLLKPLCQRLVWNKLDISTYSIAVILFYQCLPPLPPSLPPPTCLSVAVTKCRNKANFQGQRVVQSVRFLWLGFTRVKCSSTINRLRVKVGITEHRSSALAIRRHQNNQT